MRGELDNFMIWILDITLTENTPMYIQTNQPINSNQKQAGELNKIQSVKKKPFYLNMQLD